MDFFLFLKKKVHFLSVGEPNDARFGERILRSRKLQRNKLHLAIHPVGPVPPENLDPGCGLTLRLRNRV